MAQPADVQNRLKRLENEIQTLSRAVFKGETPPPGAFSGADNAAQADIEVRLQQLETQIRDLTGRIEQQSYDIQQLQQQLGAAQVGAAGNSRLGSAAQVPPYAAPPQSAVTDYTGSSYEDYQSGYGNYESPAAGSPDIPRPGEQRLGTIHTSTPVASDPSAQYERAYAFLKNQDYESAEESFNSFLQAYPEHVLAANAQYWLGETYYVRNEYAKAARVFAESYQKHPQSPKAADSLLKLGMSLAGMGKKEDACVALQQLRQEFSTTNAPVVSRAEQEMRSLDCT